MGFIINEDRNKDLGLGGRLAQASTRLMNRDGSFNVIRKGNGWRSALHPYHLLITMSWRWFLALILAAYVVTNIVFAAGYILCGPGALAGGDTRTTAGQFINAAYFSVQTLATIGYGKMTPEGHAANILVALEALTGLLGFAFATGLLFARFSRPQAALVFSEIAVIAPYQGGTALMFRLANGRPNELSNVSASVTLIRSEPGQKGRRFHRLNLERDQVTFLTLQWVVVHPIDSASPLWGISEEEFRASEVEIFAMFTAVDESSFQTASTRTSYSDVEVVWGARFRDVYEPQSDGRLLLDVRRLSEIDRVELPALNAPPL